MKPSLHFEDGRWTFTCTYEERHLPKNARFFWDRTDRVWVTRSAKCAVRLREYATDAARQAFVDVLVPGLDGRNDAKMRRNKGGGVIVGRPAKIRKSKHDVKPSTDYKLRAQGWWRP